jgi:hypothetical protein
MDQNQNDNLFNFDQQPENPPSGTEQPPDATQPPSNESTYISSGARAYETPSDYVPSVPPPPYSTPPGTAQQPPKSNRTWLIVLIVVLVLLCCCCLAFLLFMYYVGGDWLIRQLNQGMIPVLQVLA